MNESWREFFQRNFDKFLLLFLYLTLLSVVLALLVLGKPPDQGAVSWAREAAGTVLGGLLGLITGVRIGAASGAGNAIRPVPPSAPALPGASDNGGKATATVVVE